MMPAKENDFIKDFALRTKENYERLESGPYEVTQLINSMLGLLIMPTETQYNNIVDNLIDPNLLLKLRSCVSKDTYPNETPPSLQNICRHVRNATAHCHITPQASLPVYKGAPLEIGSIVFKDVSERKNGKTEKFEMELTPELLNTTFPIR